MFLYQEKIKININIPSKREFLNTKIRKKKKKKIKKSEARNLF